ncbi:MAG: RNA pyrophosphohydrolase [Pseudomonadota bacterium]
MTPEQIASLPYRPCAGVMLANNAGLVFAGQRIDNFTEAWQMPQGGIDPGEDPTEAALRELWEETGVTRNKVQLVASTQDWIPYDLPIELVPKLWGGKYRGQSQLWFLFRFLGQDADVIIETEHPEFSSWIWMDLAVLPEKIVPFKRATYERVVAELSPKIDWV